MSSIKVLLADDHPLIIEGLTVVLPRLGLDVVGHVDRATDVIKKFKQVSPDVLVLDVRFGPGATGLDIGRELLSVHPAARIVFYSQFDQNEIIRDAYQLGGLAFVTKNTAPETLVQAITTAAEGKTYFLPAIAERLALLGLRGDESPRAKLDAREMEVFLQLARGLTNNEIAERMNLSSKTISIIGQGVREKLGAQRAADLTRLAMRHGMLEP
jgi:two-component system invasion response regulator UvrY